MSWPYRLWASAIVVGTPSPCTGRSSGTVSCEPSAWFDGSFMSTHRPRAPASTARATSRRQKARAAGLVKSGQAASPGQTWPRYGPSPRERRWPSRSASA